MATSKTEICNLALQKLGAKRISDFDEDSVNARACRSAYPMVLEAELRAHLWSFAVGRATLAEEATAPSWGRAHQYQLPSDFLRLANDYAEDNTIDKDWVIEGRFILTDDIAPLYLRYVKLVTDTTQYDSLFCKALAAKLAEEMCEQLTQSNSKKAEAKADYKDAIKEARRINGIERGPQVSPDSEWIARRF